MPGPPRWRTPLLINHMLSCQKVLPKAINERVETLLAFVQRMAKRNPEVVYGDGKERTRDSEETRKFTRKLAAEGMVLLKNEGPVLPIKSEQGKVKKVAIIGPNAKERVISGGGSAALKASYIVSPFEGLTSNAPAGIELKYEVGCYGVLFHDQRVHILTVWFSSQVPAYTRELPNHAIRGIWLGMQLLQP